MNRKTLFALCLITTLFVTIGRADSPDPGGTDVFEKEIVVGGPDGPAGPEPPPGPGSFIFISSEFGGEQSNVKGAPYSAEAVTERTQVLEDGNRIITKNSAQVYRDSEGRTRREQQFGPIGPFAPASEPHLTIIINDPVKGEHYMLDPDSQTARKMPLKMRGPHPSWHGAEAGDEQRDVLIGPGPGPHMMEHNVFKYAAKPADTKTEPLGKQTMEGVEVDGTRITTTIPEGQIGNERPIEIVTEKWYSPDLQTNIMTRHSDPRFGTTTYQLKNINRTEPDKSLFQVPSGYKIEEGPAGDRVIIRKKIQN